MKLYTITKRQRSIKQFIKELYMFNSAYDYQCATTYFDKELINREHCPARRSFGDLLTIVKTEYSSVTEKQLATILFQLSEEQFIRCLYCPDISKIVFYRDQGRNINTGDYKMIFKGYLPPYGNMNHRGVDRYSYMDIIKLAGQENNCIYE